MTTNPTYHMTAADAVEWLRSWPDESFHMIVTDPPYESLEKHRSRGTTTRLTHSKASSNNWFTIFPYNRFDELFSEMYRVLAHDAHLYVFSDSETMFVAKPAAEAAGFTFWKPLIWDKQKIGMGYHYRSRYQFVLFFEKGKVKLNDLSVPDILEVERVYQGYPGEKPTAVAEILVDQSSLPGQVVADPFAGSGSTGVAAVSRGRHFWGCDLCIEAVEVTTDRLIEAGATVAETLPGTSQGQLSLL